MIQLECPGFLGSALELQQAVRAGRIAAASLPVAQLAQQALDQVQALGLAERSELLPIMADLVVYKLRDLLRLPVPNLEPEESEVAQVEGFVETLVVLEEAIVFLRDRAEARSKVIAVPPPPLPRDARLRRLPLDSLRRAIQPFARRAEVLIEPERFGLREAWERIRGFMWSLRRTLFSQLPLPGWPEQTVGFAALLEAARTGEVELVQPDNFADIEITLGGSSRETP